MSAACRRLSVHVTVLEDLHSGTGTGATAEIDALQARDAHGAPVIWSSHFRGVLRQIAEDLVQDGTGAIEPDSIQALFGAPGSGARARAVFTSLRHVPGTGIADGTPFITWHTTARASATNRCPAEDTLRAVEFVRAGAEFVGLVDLPASLVRDLRVILGRCISLGSGRTRGQGTIKVVVGEPDPAERET